MEQTGTPHERDTSRRDFVKGLAAAAGGAALPRGARTVLEVPLPPGAGARGAEGTPPWAEQIGLELFTVRDLTAKDYLGTLERVAAIGYKEVEPAGGYANLSPARFRAELDRLGLKMPSTHSGLTIGSDAEVETQLAGFQVMGIEYASLSEPRPAGAPERGPGGRAPTPPGPATERKLLEQFIRRSAQPRAVDDVKQEAARYNKFGKLARPFGIKLLVHNHTTEFIPCKDASERPYTILLAETDPELVVFQLDIGWAAVAGENPIQLFQQHPGRFVLWHVKDVACLHCLPPVSDQGARMAAARLVPVGTGEVDYPEIFKHADVAGLKHFAVEQDSAAEWGDSLAAARVSYERLRVALTSGA